jgi:signal transduction histidine kinase
MRQTDVPALRAEFGKGQYVAAATRAETMRMAVFESASFVSQHNAALRDSAEVDAQYERVSIAAVLLFIALVTDAAVLYSMSRKSDAESIFHKSFGALHGHAIQSRLTALRLFLDYMGLQGEKTVGRFEALRVDALDAVKELDGFYAKTRTIAYADSSRELEPFTEILRVMRSANVHIAHHSNVDEVKVRAAQVTLILDELIDNAITATTGTTMPQINVWAERQINIWRMGYTLLFSVEDNGHGMSPEVRRQAQTPLFTTKAGSHNGLGLSAVTQLIQSMGGTISIRSGVGLGTSVFVRLPV